MKGSVFAAGVALGLAGGTTVGSVVAAPAAVTYELVTDAKLTDEQAASWEAWVATLQPGTMLGQSCHREPDGVHCGFRFELTAPSDQVPVGATIKHGAE